MGHSVDYLLDWIDKLRDKLKQSVPKTRYQELLRKNKELRITNRLLEDEIANLIKQLEEKRKQERELLRSIRTRP